ncbi:hypothetical protein DYBT9623_01267 [Dyadobacter sp. CECT 9623]|uniref:Transposase n=1 Tax=Dyadobacter linearis TaxID=2823330 RepID=A0ABM8UM61_9BACT|nr:hypothetical protein DYBT9623_01267 [Dyadobacter sp. CECT 9623]
MGIYRGFKIEKQAMYLHSFYKFGNLQYLNVLLYT